MDFEGNCSLMIKGEHLNFEDIEKNLQIKPSRLIRNGEIVSKVIGNSQYDLWAFEIKYGNNKAINEVLNELLVTISSSREYLQNLSNVADVKIKCYLQSDFAQINFAFDSNVLKELANIDIKFEISIFSWGGIS